MANLNFKRFGLLALIFMCSFSLLQANVTQRVSLNLKETSLRDVFSDIEEQTTYRFSYRNVVIDKVKNVTVLKNNILVESVLNEILPARNLQFSIVSEKSIVISERDTKMQQTKGAKKSIVGKVLDINGEPVIGATVIEKGNSVNGTVTDIDGNFSMKVAGNTILQVSYIGYVTQNIRTGNKTTFKINLKEDAYALGETIVIGYTSQKKVNLSGAVDGISLKAIEDRPLVNVGQGLQGAIANLNVNISDGNANSSPSFNIRGVTSLKDGKADNGGPLILIDNIPVTASELSRINSNDIASITVLKDASSAAVYGARAAFGVILVTTKTANTEDIKIDVNAYYSVRKITRLPQYITDPYTVMDIKNQAAAPLYNLYPKQVMDIAKGVSANPLSDRVFVNPTDPNYWMYVGSTNWLDEVYETTAPTYNVNASVSQRTKKGGYYLSSEYFKQDGMFKFGNDIYQRYNMRVKLDYQVANILNISNNTTFTYRKYDKPYTNLGSFFHTINRTNSLDVPYNPDGSYTSAGANTIGLLKNGGREIQNSQEFQTTFALTLNILKNEWTVKADATFRRDNDLMKESEFPREYRTGPGRPFETTSQLPLAKNTSEYTNYNVYNIFTNYNKTFADNHFVQGTIGFNQENRRYNKFWLSRNALISDKYPTPTLATGEIKGSEEIEDWSVRGVFYQFNYTFDNRYILELSGRYDGTSRFPKKDRFGFFPSGSVAWNVAEEPFLNNFKETIQLDQLKLRASYGVLGNQNVNAYSYLPTMKAEEIGWILDGSRPIGVGSPGLVSKMLTWEQVSTKNFGVDLSILKNRFTVSADVYNRETNGMLTKGATLPNVLGTSEPQENAADLRTKGWELTATWRDGFMLAGSTFNYSARFAISDSRTSITRYDNPNGKLNDFYKGQDIGEIWGLTNDGYFATEEELKSLDQSAVGEDDQSNRFYIGDLKFKDLNGDGKINKGENTTSDPGDFKVIGNSSTRYPYSLDLSADWKGFDIKTFFQGIGKKDWYPGGGNHYFWGIYAQPWTNVQVQNMDHWTPENPDAYFPRVKAYIAESTGSELAAPQVKYLQDASYLRLKNVTFGYTLPKLMSSKIGIDRVRFYFSGENLCEITHLDGNKNIDPEALDGNVYPLQRSYSFGVNLNF